MKKTEIYQREKMKLLTKLVEKFLNLFRPKPKYVEPPRHGIIVEEFLVTPESPYSYSIVTNGSPGNDGSLSKASSNDTYPEDFKGVDDQMIANAACTVPIILSQELVNVCDSTLKPKSKKKLTKKQTEKQNAEIMVEILKWNTPFSLKATQLQKASRIRRERFLPLLKKLLKNGKITRIGTGQRGQPYYYGLPENRPDQV